MESDGNEEAVSRDGLYRSLLLLCLRHRRRKGHQFERANAAPAYPRIFLGFADRLGVVPAALALHPGLDRFNFWNAYVKDPHTHARTHPPKKRGPHFFRGDQTSRYWQNISRFQQCVCSLRNFDEICEMPMNLHQNRQ